MAWALADAKNRFSELVERALAEGPQEITRHGRPVVVVVPIEQWEQRRASFKEALRALHLGELDLERSRDGGRPDPLDGAA